LKPYQEKSLRTPALVIIFSFFTIFSGFTDETDPLDLSAYHLQHWDIYSGLCSDSITALFQDSSGFFWIGTYDGVMRFDGREFMTFDQSNTPGFTGHSANQFIEYQNQIWMASGQGIICYSRGQFKSYTRNEGLTSNHVNALVHDNGGQLWAGTHQGLQFFDGSAFQIPLYTHGDPFAGRSISSMLYHPLLGLTASCTDGGLYIHCETEPELVDHTEEKQISKMALYQGKIFAGDREGRLYELQSSGLKYLTFLEGGSLRDLQASLAGLWAITSSDLYRLEDGKILRITREHRDYVISEQVLKVLSLDSSGNIWLGTRSGGLYRFSPSRFRNFDLHNGLSGATVNSVAELPEGTFWIATDDGLYGLKNHRYIENELTDFLAGERIKHLQASNGTLYLSTLSGKGVVIWDGQNISQIDSRSGLPHRVVKKTLKDSHGNLWISTSSGVVSISAEGPWTVYNKDNGFISDEIYDLFEDSQGRIWISTVEDGLIRMEPNGSYQRFSEREGLTGEMVFSIRQDYQGDFWVSTSSGVFLIRKDDSLYPLSMKQGLPYLYVYSIEPLEEKLYIASVKGFSVASLEEVKETALGYREAFTLNHYDWNNGLLSSPNALSWLFPDSEGRIWIPTHGGVSCFLPDSLEEGSNGFSPRVVKAETLEQAFLDPERLELNGRVESLSLYAAVPGAPVETTLEYRLTPYQDLWMPLPSSGRTIYFKLKPGNYRFEMRITADREPSGEISSLPIRIKPENTWRFLLFLLVIPIILLPFYLRKLPGDNRTDWQGIRLEYKLTERELEILKHLSSGKRDKEIAREIGCAISTVSNTLSRIYKKTETAGRSDLILLVHKKVKKSTDEVENSTP